VTRDEGGPAIPARLLVVYDERCELCRRCRAWLESEPAYVPLRFLPAGSWEVGHLWGDLPWIGADLVVVADDGQAWIGPAAFLTCLWATKRYRGWSTILSGEALAPMAERFFSLVSHQRRRINRFLGPGDDCADGQCRNHPRRVGMPQP
jgi:predicted DCC family thiol-disulfide oxidoreductase YuxK